MPKAPIRSRRRRFLRALVRAGLGFVAAVMLYAVGFWAIALVPINGGRAPRSEGTEIFVSTNGLHTSLVLPLRTAEFDWTIDVPTAHFRDVPSWATHALFGWGDRGFFLEARTLADVRVTTALAALTYLSRSAMHVEYLHPDQLSPEARSFRVDAAEHRALVAFIRASFARDADGRTVPIVGEHYNECDAFYEGVGRYGAFYTCNTWTNEALRTIGVPTAWYAVFAGGVMRHL